MANIRRAAKTMLGVYLKGPFRKAHLVAIVIGVFVGGMTGTILMSGDHGQQHWSIVVFGFVIGATVGAGFVISLVPGENHKD